MTPKSNMGGASMQTHSSSKNQPQINHNNTNLLLAHDIGHWLIDPSEIEIEKEVGRGAYGIVYKGSNNHKNKPNNSTQQFTFQNQANGDQHQLQSNKFCLRK